MADVDAEKIREEEQQKQEIREAFRKREQEDEDRALREYERRSQERYGIDIKFHDLALKAAQRKMAQLSREHKEATVEYGQLVKEAAVITEKKASLVWASQHKFWGAFLATAEGAVSALRQIPIAGEAVAGALTKGGGAATIMGTALAAAGVALIVAIIPALIAAHARLLRLREAFVEIHGLTGGISDNIAATVSGFAEMAFRIAQIPREETYRLAGGIFQGMFFQREQAPLVGRILEELTYAGRAAPEFGPQGMLEVYTRMYTRLGIRGEELGQTFSDLYSRGRAWGEMQELSGMTTKMFIDTTLELQDQLKWWGIDLGSSSMVVKTFSKALMEGKISVGELAAAFSPEQVHRGIRLLLYARQGPELGLPRGMRPLDVVAGMGLIGVGSERVRQMFEEMGAPLPGIGAEEYYRLRFRAMEQMAAALGGGPGMLLEVSRQMGFGVITAQTERGRAEQLAVMREYTAEGAFDVTEMTEEMKKVAEREWTMEGLMSRGLRYVEATNTLMGDIMRILNNLTEFVIGEFGLGWANVVNVFRPGYLEQYIQLHPEARRAIMHYPERHMGLLGAIPEEEFIGRAAGLRGQIEDMRRRIRAQRARVEEAEPAEKAKERLPLWRFESELERLERQRELTEEALALRGVRGLEKAGLQAKRFLLPLHLFEPLTEKLEDVGEALAAPIVGWRQRMKYMELKEKGIDVTLEKGAIVINEAMSDEEIKRILGDEVWEAIKRQRRFEEIRAQ